MEVMLLAGPNKARIVLTRRKVAVAIFLEAGIDALTAQQIRLLMDIKPMLRANYRLSDHHWLEIQDRCEQSKAQLDG